MSKNRFLILDRNTGNIISADDCAVIDTFNPEVREMAAYWSDPDIETDEIAVRLHELFGFGLSTTLENLDLTV